MWHVNSLRHYRDKTNSTQPIELERRRVKRVDETSKLIDTRQRVLRGNEKFQKNYAKRKSLTFSLAAELAIRSFL